MSRGRIFTRNPSTRKRVRLARGSQPDWSPSGRSVAYRLRKNVYSVPARRGAKRRLLVRNARAPAYSPNGKRLLFLRDPKPDLGTLLWGANSDGHAAAVLLRGGEQPIGSTWDVYLDPAWRPLP